MRKKRVLLHSSFSRMKSGFGVAARELLKHLYTSEKYEVMEYANGIRWGSENEQDVPWPCRGSSPASDVEVRGVTDPNILRNIVYGGWNIDKVIQEFKPDVYIGAEDPWAEIPNYSRPWWNKITCAQYLTIDSVPLYKPLKQNLSKIKEGNLWFWSGFAVKEAAKHGYNSAKTVYPIFDTTKFFPIPKENRLNIRRQLNISDDTLVFGFVFRNQLRKLVGNLMEGFSIFQKKNPNTKSKLLLHTNFGEGWAILDFAEEFGINPNDILTTYYCKSCESVTVKPFEGNNVKCGQCNNPNSSNNITVADGVKTEQLNIIYNLCDGYLQECSSGGLEMPLAEAMLCGLPCSTVDYSFGETFISSGLVHSCKYSEYREIGSNFIKATPHASSITEFMTKLSKNKSKYEAIGLKGREWALKEFNPQKTKDFIENFIDNAAFTDYDFNFEKAIRNESYPLKDIIDNTEWLIDMYRNILLMEEDENSDGVKHWLKTLEEGRSREGVHNFFIKTAKEENARNQKKDIKDFFKNSEKNKLVYVMPESIGDCVISLNVIKSLKDTYPDYEIYVCTKPNFKMVFDPFVNDIIDGIIPYVGEIMDSFQFWEGAGENKGLVSMCFLPHILTQRIPAYTRNGLDINTLQ